MKIHYFYKRDYRQGFYDLEIVAWLEEKTISRQGDERLSFKKLERLDIFISKDVDFQSHRISHEFGKNSCIGHSAHTRKKLVEDMGKWGLKPIDRRNYERFRKVALALYHKQSLIDFSDFKGKQTYTIRTIIGD
jgi:hypothetical protein